MPNVLMHRFTGSVWEELYPTPAPHNQAISTITGLQTALDGKVTKSTYPGAYVEQAGNIMVYGPFGWHTLGGSSGQFLRSLGSYAEFASIAKGDVGLGSVENYGISTLAEAQAGTSNVKYMTPVRTREAIDNHTPGTVGFTSSKTSWATTDVNTFFRMTNSSAITISIPADTTQNFAIGTEMHFMQWSTGQVTIAPSSGVSLFGEGTKRIINARYQVVTIKKVAANQWVLFGALR